MTEPFTKLLASILDSTIWDEDEHTRIVWVTMLAMAGPDGCVRAAVPGLTRRANLKSLSDEEALRVVEAALGRFQQPDPYSRSPDHDGRRIEVIEGGWRLLSHARIRGTRDPEVRREQNREAARRHRERQRVSQSKPPSATVSHGKQEQAHTDTEADTDPEEKEKRERLARAASIPIHDPVAAAHDPDVVDVLATDPPPGCRPWGPSDAAECHRQVRGNGIDRVVAVIAFVRDSIVERRQFGDRVAQPKDWANLWKYDGDPWDRWHQRFCERGADPPPVEDASREDFVREQGERAGLDPAHIDELVAKAAKENPHGS